MSAHWLWPQWVIVGMSVFSLTVAACIDGTPKTGKNRFAIKLVDSALGLWILWEGGFFS